MSEPKYSPIMGSAAIGQINKAIALPETLRSDRGVEMRIMEWGFDLVKHDIVKIEGEAWNIKPGEGSRKMCEQYLYTSDGRRLYLMEWDTEVLSAEYTRLFFTAEMQLETK